MSKDLNKYELQTTCFCVFQILIPLKDLHLKNLKFLTRQKRKKELQF